MPWKQKHALACHRSSDSRSGLLVVRGGSYTDKRDFDGLWLGYEGSLWLAGGRKGWLRAGVEFLSFEACRCSHHMCDGSARLQDSHY